MRRVTGRKEDGKMGREGEEIVSRDEEESHMVTRTKRSRSLSKQKVPLLFLFVCFHLYSNHSFSGPCKNNKVPAGEDGG